MRQKCQPLLEEMIKIACIPRTNLGCGWMVSGGAPRRRARRPDAARRGAGLGSVARRRGAALRTGAAACEAGPDGGGAHAQTAAGFGGVRGLVAVFPWAAPHDLPLTFPRPLLLHPFPLPSLPQTPSLACVEMMQCVAQALPVSARKASGGKGSDTLAPLLALPHFDQDVVKRLRKQRVNSIKGEYNADVGRRQL